MTDYRYANGMTIFSAKKWFEYTFREFFHLVKKNDEERRFDIFLFDKVQYKDKSIQTIDEAFDLEDFREFWGREFHLVILDVKIKSEV